MQMIGIQAGIMKKVVSHPRQWKGVLLHPRRALENTIHHPGTAWLLGGAALALAAAEAILTSSHSPSFVKSAALVWAGLAAALCQFILWAAWSAALYVGVMLLGGRSRFHTLFRVVIYAWLPYCVLLGIRLVYLLAAGQQITSPGLSGFAGQGLESLSLGQAALAHFLAQVHLYLGWHLYLLARGTHRVGRIGLSKAVGLVILCWMGGMVLAFLPQLILSMLAFQGAGV
jgi:hypothetical protein